MVGLMAVNDDTNAAAVTKKSMGRLTSVDFLYLME